MVCMHRGRVRGAILVALGMCLGGLGVHLGGEVRAGLAVAEPVQATPVDYSRYRKLDMFARSLALIEQHYVRPVDSERLVYAAVAGLVAELDPHSEF